MKKTRFISLAIALLTLSFLSYSGGSLQAEEACIFYTTNMLGRVRAIQDENGNPVGGAVRVGYTAMALGEMEFMYGLEALKRCIKEANFPLLSANVIYEDTGEYFTKPYFICNTSDGLKVGITAVTDPDIPLSAYGFSNLEVDYPSACLSEIVDTLKTEKDCDLVIVLSNLGEKEDRNLADSIEDINIIIGRGARTTSPSKVYQSIPQDIDKGVSMFYCMKCFRPYGDDLVLVKMTGSVILDIIDYYEEQIGTTKELVFSSGFDPEDQEINGRDIDEDEEYIVAVNNYLADEGAGYTMFGDEEADLITVRLTEPVYDPEEETLKYKAEIIPHDHAPEYAKRHAGEDLAARVDERIPETFGDVIVYIHSKEPVKEVVSRIGSTQRFSVGTAVIGSLVRETFGHAVAYAHSKRCDGTQHFDVGVKDVGEIEGTLCLRGADTSLDVEIKLIGMPVKSYHLDRHHLSFCKSAIFVKGCAKVKFTSWDPPHGSLSFKGCYRGLGNWHCENKKVIH